MSDTRHIATEDIYAAPGVLAYTKGSEVPASAIENLKVQDKVASASSKAAKEAVKPVETPAK